MQPQLAPATRGIRLDGRSSVAAAFCLLALFSDGLGWLFAIVGIVLLRRAKFSRSVKWFLAGIAILPKLLFVGIRSLTAPQGVSFPIEPSNLATSPSLWAWSSLLVAFGVIVIIAPRRLQQSADAPVQPGGGRSLLISAAGVLLIVVAFVMLLGLTDGFHRIDDAGQGRWALRHAARGVVATFAPADVASIDATEVRASRSGTSFKVAVALTDGRTFSAGTRSLAAVEELRKFATTAGLPGKVRIQRRNSPVWISGASGIGVKDCVGTYQSVDERAGKRSTYEFWLEGGRLSGKETVADSTGTHVRVLRNLKLSDTGDVQFDPASYIAASKDKNADTTSFSFNWGSAGETGRFANGGFETGMQKYRKL